MRGPLLVTAVVAVAGIAFVIAYDPSGAESRGHDWLAVAFIAATAGIFFAAGTSPRRRVLLLGMAYALLVLTTMAWLVESVAMWAALAVVVAGAVVLVRRSAAPR